jgi:hypothetical protein
VDVVRRNYDRAQINLDLMFMKAAIEQDAPGAVWEPIDDASKNLESAACSLSVDEEGCGDKTAWACHGSGGGRRPRLPVGVSAP